MLDTKEETVEATVEVDVYVCDVCGATYMPEWRVGVRRDEIVAIRTGEGAPDGWKTVFDDPFVSDSECYHVCPHHDLDDVFANTE